MAINSAMNKIIKISQINKTVPKYKRVEWWLHNVCNFNCSFCDDKWKSGSHRWLDLSVYKKFTDKLMQQATAQNTFVFFQFLGGEPTLFPHLLELSQHVVNKGHYVELMTNGSRTLNYWKNIADANVLNTLYLTIHPEQTKDIQHYVDLIKLFENKNVLIISRVSAPIAHFNTAVNFCDVLDKESSCIIALHPINNTFGNNSYNNEQLEIFNNKSYYSSKLFNSPILPHYYPWRFEVTTDSNSYHAYPNDLYLKNLNNFKNFTCYAGVDFLKIFHEEIYKANCEQDGMIGKISNEDLGFLDTPTICNQNLCFCRADIAIEKYKSP